MKPANNLINPILHVVLDRPKIAGNIASIVRLCTGCQAALHVCGPLIFDQSDKIKWRAGLDYFYGARVHFHNDLYRCLSLLGKKPWVIEVGGEKAPWDVQLQMGDVIVLGPEDGSVLPDILEKYELRLLTLPMNGPIRSLNLAQCASVVLFDAIRQFANI